jgi:hypothetical protein
MDKLPSPSDLVPVIVDCLTDLGGRAHIQEIEKAAKAKLNLDIKLTSQIRIGKRTEFAYRLSWARTAAKAKGLITKDGASYWKIV